MLSMSRVSASFRMRSRRSCGFTDSSALLRCSSWMHAISIQGACAMGSGAVGIRWSWWRQRDGRLDTWLHRCWGEHEFLLSVIQRNAHELFQIAQIWETLWPKRPHARLVAHARSNFERNHLDGTRTPSPLTTSAVGPSVRMKITLDALVDLLSDGLTVSELRFRA